jgi:DNA topoisomerase-1
MVQPPAIFVGHATTPKRGHIKKRIKPQDVTLNLSKKDGAPVCSDNGVPCKWGDIIENRKVTWLATYKNPITGSPVYVYLSRQDSHFVHRDDIAKFDKARKLGENIELVRKRYSTDLTSENSTAKQLATAVYLLDVLAIRPGTEKDEEKEANTLGLTTLGCTNVKFEKDNNINLNFLGKSSIEFSKKFKIDERVYKNLQELCKKGGKLFPSVDETTLNAYLKSILPEITAKVFRTYKAGSTLQKQLDKTNPDESDTVHRKKLLFDKANMEVAVALNHKNMTVSDAKVEKLEKKLKELRQDLKKATTAKSRESVEKKIEKAEADLAQAKGNISLTTSKVNYIDPRIVVSWCKKHEIPIEKIYQKTALKKFVWSMDAKSDWKFIV